MKVLIEFTHERDPLEDPHDARRRAAVRGRRRAVEGDALMPACVNAEPGTPHAKRPVTDGGMCRTCNVIARRAAEEAARKERETVCLNAADDRRHRARPVIKRVREGWLCATCARSHQAASRDRIRANRLQNTYGISSAAYGRLKAAQGGVCAICGPVTGRNGHTKALAVDHRHDTPVRDDTGRVVRWDGPVRGLLCSDCNRIVGLWRDDPAVAARALLYLAGSSGVIDPEQVRLARVSATVRTAGSAEDLARIIGVDTINS